MEKLELMIQKILKESESFGQSTVKELEVYLRGKLAEYERVLGTSQLALLENWEEKRNYSAPNFYQQANQPALNGKNVRVFETVEEMIAAIGEKQFRCPLCEAVSTEPYECNSGAKVNDGKTCDWKVYGLFGHMGKGVHVYVKSKMRGNDIFMPLSWEEQKQVEPSPVKEEQMLISYKNYKGGVNNLVIVTSHGITTTSAISKDKAILNHKRKLQKLGV